MVKLAERAEKMFGGTETSNTPDPLTMLPAVVIQPVWFVVYQPHPDGKVTLRLCVPPADPNEIASSLKTGSVQEPTAS
jgi:hypothetical protein